MMANGLWQLQAECLYEASIEAAEKGFHTASAKARVTVRAQR